ncbi:MAG: MATE family efflux transporter [Clostridiaceae bacterium]|nr:MATE family efflux transporter [Clostridiaceae bacterium]
MTKTADIQNKGSDKTHLMNMTQGQPWRLILRFALPLLLGNILQQLYNIVDSAVVGNFVGKTALAAVGTAFPVIFLINSLFMGIGMGATIIISQYYGAGDRQSVKKAIDTIYLAMLVIVVPLSVLGILLSHPLLLLMNTPADTIGQATTYMQIIFIGTLASFGYNINSGILQGLGDSRSPLIYLSIATVLNIILDLAFVLLWHWDVAGVAWATIISQLVSFLFGIYHINRRQAYIRIHLRHLDFDWNILKDSVRLGLPAGLQNMFFSLGTMVLQSLINSYQSTFMAGFNGASKIDSFAFLPLLTFSTAIMTYVGQNIGAGRLDRVKKGIRSTLVLSTVVSLAICTLILLTAGYLMRLFTDEPDVILAGEAYLIRVVPFYILLSVLFIVNGALRGAGESIIPLVATMASLWLARVPLAYFLADRFGRDNMFFSFPLGWLIGLAIVLPYYFSGRWRSKSMVRDIGGPSAAEARIAGEAAVEKPEGSE